MGTECPLRELAQTQLLLILSRSQHKGVVKKYHVFALDCHVNIGFTFTKNELFAKPGGLHWKRKHF